MAISVASLGAKGDGQTDDTEAFADALHADDPVIYVPPGRYRIKTSLELKKCTRLFGEGGAPRRALSTLIFESGGIVVTSEDGDAAKPNGRGSRIHDLAIERDPTNGAPALSMRASASVERCYFVSGDGSAIDVDGRESERCNSNGWVARDCTFEDARGWAIETHGSDANAGLADHCSAVSCDGGFYDGSFLGSVWIGCHAEDCGKLGGYLCDGQAARAYFLACYCEADSAGVWIGPAATVDGGTLASVMRALPSYSARLSQHKGAWRDGRAQGHTTWTTYGASGQMAVALGVPDGRTVLQWQAGEDTHELAIKAERGPMGPIYAVEGANTPLLTAFAVTRQGHKAGPFRVTIPRGVWKP